jgi:hypothetical protein
VGGVAALALVTGLAFFFWKRRLQPNVETPMKNACEYGVLPLRSAYDDTTAVRPPTSEYESPQSKLS